jgi:phospholipase C
MMENHSFDNFFGIYPSVNLNPLPNFTLPRNLLSNRTLLSELSVVPAGTFNTANPKEFVYGQDFDNGKMDALRNIRVRNQ